MESFKTLMSLDTIAIIISAVAMVLTFFSVREMKLTRIEESRAYIVFYIDRVRPNEFHEIIIKNFGRTAGTLLEISVNPPLSFTGIFEPVSKNTETKPLTDCKNIFLAPGQSVWSNFDFRTHDEKVFSVAVKYETLGRTYTDEYTIDINHRASLISLGRSSEAKAIDLISNSISEISERLR